LHIDLRVWADLLLIAPLSAHTLAKLSNGLCDDTLSCVVRAWDFGHGERPGKPLILAPAMNTAMWQHPLTRLQLCTIRGFWNTTGKDPREGVSIICPQVKKLACGEIGNGALASVEDIMKCVIINDILSGIPTGPKKKAPKRSRARMGQGNNTSGQSGSRALMEAGK
jgi:phosphopantothenoylcysteine decarboxylase